jgi:hypothetical protein
LKRILFDSCSSPPPVALLVLEHYVNYDHEVAHLRLGHDYFNNDCVYPVILPLEVPYVENFFLSIMHKLSETSPYFTERHDATGHIGLTLL